MSNIYSKKPIIILSVIEPGTMGDLSFVDKMIDSDQKQKNDQPFVILLNDLGDETLKYKSFVQTLKNTIGEEDENSDHVVAINLSNPFPLKKDTLLNLIVNGFKQSQEYTILKTGQGVVTTLLNLETDSVKEFNKIVEEATDELKSKSNVRLS
ncbi:hypothetical protein [Legionella bononiensis]|uniref:DrrA phosphatidylinositol 4-phosphate binding domain-containing protein n=1 Tax=Legionella bononiensis TaxID=2793102 RepID=A0ABS1WAL2_9GAMM|nr:hypothetical protein [Legionella bononiensis]MBL7526388.1 hypothetical protein [Legionella bononiensis]MBL7563118.1 hypothetical protein [Legionella bononiensis]